MPPGRRPVPCGQPRIVDNSHERSFCATDSRVTAVITASARAEAIKRLRAAGCVFAEDEAAVLAAAATGEAALAAMVERRAAGEPLEQVVGYADFCGVRVRLRPGVFVPRVRSELLVRVAAEAAAPGDVVVDLCCGSGALGLAVRHRQPAIDLYAADVDPEAVACARDNLDTPVFQGDLFEALPASLRGRIAVLLANVPYVATRHIPLLPSEARDHEPRTALDGGGDGLDIFRSVVAGAADWLAPGGIVLSEITEAQSGTATKVILDAGLDADLRSDEDLEAMVVSGRKLVARLR
jgi:release factor glutamine methyltransferase